MRQPWLYPSVIKDVITNAKKIPGHGGKTLNITDQVVAVTNDAGKVITAYPKTRK